MNLTSRQLKLLLSLSVMPQLAGIFIPALAETSLLLDASTHSEPDSSVESSTSSPLKSNALSESSEQSPQNPDTHTTLEIDRPSTDSSPSDNSTGAATLASVELISPIPNSLLDSPVTAIALKFPKGKKVILRINGKPVDEKLIGRTETDNATQQVMQTWYGVALQDGQNTIEIALDGQVVTTSNLQVRGKPTKLVIESVESRIPADGRSLATIKGQLLDEKGNRSGRDAIVTVVSNAGEFVGADQDRDQPGFQVQAINGQFTTSLKSGLEPKQVTVRAILGEINAFTQLNFETNLRPSIATGMINLRLGKRGTDFYSRLRDFLPADGDNHTELDVKASAFATGKIGEWLFTGAYNSYRPLNQSCEGTTRLFRDTQFCDQTYPVYGDSSSSYVMTPSTDQVFLKFERNSSVLGAGTDYGMWGDYSTEEFTRPSQEFTATGRQLHGLKLNYNLGNLQFTGMYGNNLEGFQRDAIAPDGTSGYYFLSRRLLIEGSEAIYLETEELNRPGTVISRKQMNRGADYEIDYDRGTLLFRKPILRTDIAETGETLVRRIVATYQFDQVGAKNQLYAGRLQYHFSRSQTQPSWLGATYLKEDRGSRQFELYGADTYISLGDRGSLIAEYARSKNDSEFLRNIEGDAYRVDLNSQIATGIQGRAYLRSASSGFANNATTSFVPGQTRYGAQVSAAVTPTTNLRVNYDHEDNKGVAPRPLLTLGDLLDPRLESVPGTRVDNSLTTISAGIQQRFGKSDLTVDWLHRNRTDRLTPGILDSKSNQLRSRLTVPLSKTLTFLAQNELTLSSQVDAVYSDRTLLGLNWAVMPGVNVQLAEQIFTRGQLAGRSLTSLSVTGDRNLGPDTKLTGRYSLLGAANEMTLQGALGLSHRIRLSPGLKMDLAYEHIFGGSAFKRTAIGQQFAQPYAFGQGASALGLSGGDSYSVGIDYTDSPSFNASARFDHRSSSGGSNTVISAGAAGKLSPSLTALVRYQQASASNQKLVALGNTVNLKVGLAYRNPNSDKFNALLRYEYRKNPATIPDSILFSSGTGSEDHLFAAEVIYAPSWRWELYSKFGLRNSKSYLSSDLAGSSTVTLAQVRATYRLAHRWDLTGEGRWINQPGANFSETGWLAELGYYVTPNLRLVAGYSFGRVRDRDFDGSRHAQGPYLGVTVKLNELFNGFGLQKVAPPQQHESKTSPQAVKSQSARPSQN